MRLTLPWEVVLIAIFAVLISASPAAGAWAGSGGTCTWNGVSYDCHTVIDASGSPAKPVSDGGGLTAGPKTCATEGQKVECSNKYGTFSDSAACSGYVKLAAKQDPAPAGQLEGSGAWYECTYPCVALQDLAGSCPAGVGAVQFWSATPLPGVQQYTPAQAAAALARSFKLTPLTIGMAPARKVHADDPPATAPYRRTWVGVPVWLWVADPTPLTYGPYSQTATLGGVTVTARAAVSQVEWSSGAGNDITCTAGTPFESSTAANEPATDSPTCGFRFQRTSSEQPDKVWNVTATSHWTVSWTGGGQAGTLQLTNLTATTPVRVGELQSVNLPVTPDEIGGSR